MGFVSVKKQTSVHEMQITFCLKPFIKSKLYKDYIQPLLQYFSIQIKLGDNEIQNKNMSIFSMLLTIRCLNGCKRMKYASADMMQNKKGIRRTNRISTMCMGFTLTITKLQKKNLTNERKHY